MKKYTIAIGAMLISPIAIACTVVAIAPLKIDVSLWDIAVEWFQGNRDNPANGAFLSDLDSKGEAMYGKAAWRANNYQGYVYPTASVAGTTGMTQIYVDIPCGETAREDAGTWQGPGGGGTANSYGGHYVPGMWGIVSFEPQFVTATVCADGTCWSQQLIAGYTAVYGYLPGNGGPGGGSDMEA